jgi:FixJ family two-component response regulator
MNAGDRSLIGVVDDDRSVLESLEDLLESAGYAVRTFDNAESFQDSDAVGAVDCVISDICMPGMDGRTLAERIGRIRPGLPFIFITGRDSTPESTARSGALRKPFDGSQLLAAVGTALGGKR